MAPQSTLKGLKIPPEYQEVTKYLSALITESCLGIEWRIERDHVDENWDINQINQVPRFHI